jgi:ABC-type transporter Mla MlaB component
LPLICDSPNTVVFSFFTKKNTPPPRAALKSATARGTVPGYARDAKNGGDTEAEASQTSPNPAFADLSILSEISPFGGASFEFDAAAGDRHPAVEEAAMLHANDQSAAACVVLEEVVPAQDLGASAARAWGMLFELYQRLGRREPFEALALKYASRFESSPPAWTESTAGAALAPSASSRKAALVLTGTLDAGAAERVAQISVLAAANANARLDLARLADADNDGCALLLNAFRQIKKSRKEIAVSGADHLIELLARKIVVGQRESEQSWLLLLELYQRQARHDEYEDTAVNYAITFEVSPPAWETPKSKPVVAAAPERHETADGDPHGEDGYPLEGEIVSAGADAFAGLQAYGNNLATVTIDARNLMRIDFVSAGQLLNTVSRLQLAGKQVRICGLSHLVLGLFEILGIAQMAEIHLRRH